MDCRHCNTPLRHVMVDLGTSPLCESFVAPENFEKGESWYPLKVFVCHNCLLVQLDLFVAETEIFHDYAYFSSFSTSWLAHASAYVEKVSERFKLGKDSFVVEVASNDGYLLQYVAQRGIPCLGVEPSYTVAAAAREKGIETREVFFGADTATEVVRDYRKADLIAGNNVYAHVPDINDFTAGIANLLAPEGVVTLEFPHLYQLVTQNQFDTIYHEHFSYLSLHAVRTIFASRGLRVFDVEEIPSHGGSLRVYGCLETAAHAEQPAVGALLAKEHQAGMLEVDYYTSFKQQVDDTKRKLLSLLIRLKNEGKSIAGYGAPGKGNTLLNYCGISTDFLDFTVDRNPYKLGRKTPGMRIPIYAPDHIQEAKPDYLLILPWNLKKEIMEQCAYIAEWGGRFIVPIPEPVIL